MVFVSRVVDSCFLARAGQWQPGPAWPWLHLLEAAVHGPSSCQGSCARWEAAYIGGNWSARADIARWAHLPHLKSCVRLPQTTECVCRRPRWCASSTCSSTKVCLLAVPWMQFLLLRRPSYYHYAVWWGNIGQLINNEIAVQRVLLKSSVWDRVENICQLLLHILSANSVGTAFICLGFYCVMLVNVILLDICIPTCVIVPNSPIILETRHLTSH